MIRFSKDIFRIALCLFAVGCAGSVPKSGKPTPGPARFMPFGFRTPDDPRAIRLCDEAADPENATHKIQIHCRLEGDSFRSSAAPATSSAVILAYNIERGFNVAQQTAWLTGPTGPNPDILLLSEVDRGCKRTNWQSVARRYAQALGAQYVYGVEYVELREQADDPPPCEIGNAIVSRYPIGNVRLIRFGANPSWFLSPERRVGREHRLGGRMALAADIDLGHGWLRVYSVHLSSNFDASLVRLAQARALLRDAEGIDYPAVIGGDFNAPVYWLNASYGDQLSDPIQVLIDAGFVDAHTPLPARLRPTEGPFLILDALLGRNLHFADPGICRTSACEQMSDHLPIWATVQLQPVLAQH